MASYLDKEAPEEGEEEDEILCFTMGGGIVCVGFMSGGGAAALARPTLDTELPGELKTLRMAGVGGGDVGFAKVVNCLPTGGSILFLPLPLL